jgi:hypothetical protein
MANAAGRNEPPWRGVFHHESSHGSKEDIMTRLKMLAVTVIATLAIGAGGLAAAPSASAKPIKCAAIPRVLDVANQALAGGKYYAALALYERLSDEMKKCYERPTGAAVRRPETRKAPLRRGSSVSG